MSADREIIKPRTLFEIKIATKFSDPPGCMRAPALREMRQIGKQLRSLLGSLTIGHNLLSSDLLERYRIISAQQRKSLILGQKGWLNTEISGHSEGGLENWLGDERLDATLRMGPDGFPPLPDDDLEVEQLAEVS